MTEKFVDYFELLADAHQYEPEVNYIHKNTGPNRRERRHGYTRTGKHYIVPAEYRELPVNTSYRKVNDNESSVESPS